MLQRIRLAMQGKNDGGKLGGDVEVDETYIGGKARNMHCTKRRMLMESTLDQRGQPSKKNRWSGKQPVLGILERGKDGTSCIRTKTFPTFASIVCTGSLWRTSRKVRWSTQTNCTPTRTCRWSTNTSL